MKLKIGTDEALGYLIAVDNKGFQKAISEHWHVSKEGFARAQSVLWLFCWAKTGMGSQETAEDVQAVFDAIFPFTYNYFNSSVDHQCAREKRYTTGDIEKELDELLGY